MRDVTSRRGLAARVARAAVALGCAVPLAGCGLFSSGVTITSPSVMTVTSGTFEHGSIMPGRFTCDGPHRLTPPLTWTGAPAGTKSIAIVFDDADAPITPYVYWVVFDIGPGTSAMLEGKLPPGARQARGTAGYDKYDAPCPGSGGHGYRFTVYALNTVLNLPNGTSLQSAWRAIAAATIGRGRLPVSATS
ncbi:YbhB/YbcL family Raf kinase inhibitor-like protein [Trebonia kvetii]|uniref:YbhB/YbcL family Raf kinase inhibitor-like protein n=1 Tax=Trebonia kvetii TaxID=2480626 RepID=A0A6P2C2X6_9ACTN|nr:YbhB/YbcL family Raf kinase inhibitor-like protein [Trebonia kvetii]TVZ05520.1 YbhB/YbcL family Raf kinase inhibitor-like protein [Trebonia kvetii]